MNTEQFDARFYNQVPENDLCLNLTRAGAQLQGQRRPSILGGRGQYHLFTNIIEEVFSRLVFWDDVESSVGEVGQTLQA